MNRVADWYSTRLKGQVVTPTILPGYLSSWAQYTVLLENSREREDVQARLKAEGIPTNIYYPRGLHQQEALRWMGLGDDIYPNTVEASNRCLSLPMHPYLTEIEVGMICDAILRE